MQARGGLVEDVEGPARGPLRELPRQLDALRLPAREGGRGLAEGDVAEADVGQGLEGAADLRVVLEKQQGLVHGQVEDVGDREVVVLDL